MCWDWTWSSHFIVVINKSFFSRKIVLRWNCIRINIHEIIHVNLKSEVVTKPFQLCIFIHNVLLLCLCFLLLLLFHASPVRTFNIFSCKYLIIIIFLIKLFSQSASWPPSTVLPLSLFAVDLFQGFFLSYFQ